MEDSKMVNISSVPLSPAPAIVVSFLILQVTQLVQADEDDQLYFIGIIPVVFGCINYTLLYVDLGLPLQRFMLLQDFPGYNIRIYIETAVVVVLSYLSLLVVNWSYIWLAVFPVIVIGFIVALCNELNRQSGSQQRSDDAEASVGSRSDQKTEGLKAVALVPYWALCILGHLDADKFAISQFLLFFSSMLGVLTMMTTKLAVTGVAPGLAPASVLLRRASLIVLLVAVHVVAAEQLGEDVVFFFLTEAAPVLLWFSLHLDRGDNPTITADKMKLHRSTIVGLSAAAAAILAMALQADFMDESSVLSWCTKALVSCGVSGLLIYYVVFMLCQWPGQDGKATPSLQEPVKLLKFWANALLTGAAIFFVFTSLAAVRLGLHEPMVPAPAS
ncbi:uncharacterized protein LOC133911792 [Phragmites australis]|uniref:uncharacterized protein LOC133911792 n=1 Tax=Phragmites australis TaxID=29695 RepID=UPI002D79B366|nr:uncharacterized protein LOC133911792 [Phragmites australis]